MSCRVLGQLPEAPMENDQYFLFLISKFVCCRLFFSFLLLLSLIVYFRKQCIIQQKLKELDMAQVEMQRSPMSGTRTLNPNQVDLTQASPFIDSQRPSTFPVIDRVNLVSLQELSDMMLLDLENRNFSVVDNYVEESLIGQVMEEVRKLYEETSSFQPGQLTSINKNSGHPAQANKEVRGDLVTWVDSTTYPEMKSLMSAVRRTDELIAMMSSDQKLVGCNIRSRSSVMVACYPGQGTRYKRHVDNPYKDGRKLTTILYLNENYDAARDGGVLRIYKPDGSSFYEIEPVFGRLIVFWSDSRTPHEVLPSYRERFAISVWYFDTKERNDALSGVSATNL